MLLPLEEKSKRRNSDSAIFLSLIYKHQTWWKIGEMLWTKGRYTREDKPLGLGGVYMWKLAPGRVSYWHDIVISYRVYMKGWDVILCLHEETLHASRRVFKSTNHLVFVIPHAFVNTTNITSSVLDEVTKRERTPLVRTCSVRWGEIYFCRKSWILKSYSVI